MLAVVIPCYQVKTRILAVLSAIPADVDRIFVVDDACPDGTGEFVTQHCSDPRVTVLRHEKNLGVGGAMKTGYRKALEYGADIVVKLDGDGQMDPALIPGLVKPITGGAADYVKGNRFYDITYLRKMPGMRRFGNSIISFISKMSSGYWNLMDPSNGFTAISAAALRYLPLDRITNRYFFESDMLFRLNTIRAVVHDFPMKAVYNGENSSLKIWRVSMVFPFQYLSRTFKRIFYNYFLRDFNIGSFDLVIAFLFLAFGFIFGAIKWNVSIESSHPATAGTVLLAGLPIILGFQALISFLHYDVGNIPQKSITSMSLG